MSFDFGEFKSFIDALTIDSKEKGAISLGQNLTGTQHRWLTEIKRGLENDVHEFVTLKCRQIGISTISLAVDMYHAFKHHGTSGAIVVHEEGAREQFRAILSTYIASLPDEWVQEIVVNNRHQLVLGNRSILQYKVAGVREASTKTLGRSSAISFAHCTEVAYWGDPAQIDGFKATMAESNPNRFYHWETTANGFNHFHSMWKDAHDSVSVMPIFCTWYHHDFYRVGRDTNKYRQYWGHKGRLTKEERDVVRRVKLEYDFDIDDEQMAWYRWYRAEKATSEEGMLAEFPSVPEEAFVATGTNFFSGQSLTKAFQRVLSEPKPKSYQFLFGEDFTDTRIRETPQRVAHLKVYEEPQKNGFYTLGADPAYGSSETADRYTISVHRCWANKVEQVAELCVVDLSTYTFAWCVCYLAGCYQPCIYNIEFNGPGGAVIQEIDNLRRLAGRSFVPGQAKTMLDVVRKIQEFLYVKEDSIRGRPLGKHTMTTARIKDAYLNMYRDAFEREIYTPRSKELLDEMQGLVREGSWIGAEGTGKDDRVIADALAYKAYNDQLRLRLIGQNVIWIPAEERAALAEGEPNKDIMGRRVQSFLADIGYKKPAPEVGVKAYNLGVNSTYGKPQR